MESGDYDPPLAPGLLLAQSWQVTVILGAVTLILGLIVSFHPGGSLNVVAVLVGILMICSGIFHLVRIFGRGEAHRIWLGISGLLLIVIGVVLIRHLHLTLALIGLYVGITWIVQGVTALIAGIAGAGQEGRGLVDRLRGAEPDRRDRGDGHPGRLGHRPGRPARRLVHRHRLVRDHRRDHAPARGEHHGTAGPVGRAIRHRGLAALV